MTTATIASREEFLEQVGRELGVSDWELITQDRVNLFAEATGDHQWIHVDPHRAKDGPFGTTVAHGYLTLALAPLLARQVVNIEGARMGVNYGSNRVRFPAPVRVGSRIRARVKLAAAEPVEPEGVQVTYGITFEVEGREKPGCVAEVISRYYF